MLYPPDNPHVPWTDGKQPCRPQMQTGCIELIHYWRHMSNRLPEYGPFDRIIDRGRLINDVDMEAVYGPDRYTWSVSIACLGVSQIDRPDFEEFFYPSLGMACTIETEEEREALTS